MFYPLVPPPTVEIIAELHNITVLEGEDATFKCVVSPEDTQLVWSLNGQPIVPSERFVISSNGLCHMLCIYNCQVSDCATVTAEAEGLVSEANLQVQGEIGKHCASLVLKIFWSSFMCYMQHFHLQIDLNVNDIFVVIKKKNPTG